MAEKYTGWKKRYSYLDDYKKGMNGEYVYYGRHYQFQGTETELCKYKWILGIADIVLTALYILSGCMDAGGIWNTWYVILPFALEVVALFLIIWKSITLIMEKNPIKAYIYKKTVPWIRPCGVILIISSLTTAGTGILYLILTPENVRITGFILFLIFTLLIAAASIILLKLLKKYTWELDPSEEFSTEQD